MSLSSVLWLVRRFVSLALSVFLVSALVFVVIHRLPGSAFVSQRYNPVTLKEFERHYNLDLPLLQQYWIYLKGVVHGDLGESLVNRGVELTPLLGRELLVSLQVGALGLFVTIVFGLGLGLAAALRHNTWVDDVASTAAVIGYSVPNFVVATVLVYVFGTLLYGWTGGAVYYEVGWGSTAQIPIPALALGIPFASIVARLTRASVLDVIRQDYVRTAWAKGLSGRRVIVRHVIRNALIPVVTILGPLSAGILTGVVVIENIFGIPGLGKEFIDSIVTKDYNVVVSVFTLYAALIGAANIAVDALYLILDPAVRR